MTPIGHTAAEISGTAGLCALCQGGAARRVRTATPLPGIKRISGANVLRNAVMIPHVTSHAVADVTDLETFRIDLNKEYEKSGVKITMLAFLVQAAAASLRQFPEFNSSLDGENLILKRKEAASQFPPEAAFPVRASIPIL
jgi:pyruvate/2-oxoglutarate dehydrogenase complex dihydrolipoamide acyltransferase (E2) component